MHLGDELQRHTDYEASYQKMKREGFVDSLLFFIVHTIRASHMMKRRYMSPWSHMVAAIMTNRSASHKLGMWIHTGPLADFVTRAADKANHILIIVVQSTDDCHRNAVGLVCRALGCSLISWSSWVQVLKGHPVSVVSFLPAKQTKLSLRISSHVEPSLRAILDSIVTARGWATYNSTTECLAAYEAYLAGRGARSRPWNSIRLVAGDGVDFTSKTRRCAITAAKLVVTVSELCREMSVPCAERHLVV